MEYRILGPLEVRSGGEEIALPRAKQRALVLALLLKRNEAVSTDRLIEALWGEKPPATAATALQGHVSRLRKLLPPDTLLTRPTGYELRVQPSELDLERFAELRGHARASLDAGDAAEAAQILDDALALWRGPPLADLAYDASAQTEIGRLEEVRAETIEERMEALLALGRHDEAVAELEALVRAEPFRERRRAQLMLALYRSGRQADALDVYQEGRRRLVDDLGIEPGPALQELQQQILAQDPALRPEMPQHAPREATREARRPVTVVACGFVLDAVDPEALRGASESQLAVVRTIVGRHGGVVERELLDLAVATFGAASVYEDAPLRAARAAVELRAALTARLSVASGEAVVGAGGTVGGPVMAAQRLQLVAEPGEILLDHASAQLLREAVDVEPAGSALRLLHVDRDIGAVGRRLDSPLVGREHELRQLELALERATEQRTPQRVTIVGPAGVGKSRLVAELLQHVGATVSVLRGRCLSYGEGITFWPIRDLIRAATAAAEGEPVSAETLAGLLDENDAAALAGLFGEGTASTNELALAVRALLERLASDRPAIVVLDDLEHAEDALLDLVDFVVEWSRDVALLMVCVGRPNLVERRPAWAGGRASAVSIALDALSARECAALLGNLLGGAQLAEPAAERLIAAAEGNPFFLEQLVSMLIDDGLLRLEDGCWTPVGDLAGVRLPASIQLLLAARLDLLPPAELAVLECASVEGVVFQGEAVGAVLDDELDRQAIDAALRSLVAKGLTRPTAGSSGGDAYRFPHLLIRDAAYAAMPKAMRGQMHERFARWIETTGGDRVVELEEVLGHHLEQAYRLQSELGMPDPALAAAGAARLEAAGARAHARGDYGSAAGLLRRAEALAPRPELLPLLLSSLRLSGRLADARAAADGALAAVRGDERLEAHVLLEECSIRLMSDPAVQLDEITKVAEGAVAVFEAAGDEPGLARAYALLGDVWLFRCRFAELEAAHERALEHARRAHDAYACAHAQTRLSQAAFLGPRPVESGIERCDEILAADDAGPTARAHAFAVRGVLQAMREDFDAARTELAASRAVAEEFGLDRVLAWLPGFAACAELLAGDGARAEAELRDGYDRLRRLGETAVLATTAALLAQALELEGNVDAAHELAVESENLVGGADLVSRVYWCQARSRIHARRGETAQAEASAREAVELASATDMLSVHGSALLDLAAALAADQRADVVRQAAELFAAKGDAVGLRRATAST